MFITIPFDLPSPSIDLRPAIANRVLSFELEAIQNLDAFALDVQYTPNGIFHEFLSGTQWDATNLINLLGGSTLNPATLQAGQRSARTVLLPGVVGVRFRCSYVSAVSSGEAPGQPVFYEVF